jgi:hypothetical protein
VKPHIFAAGDLNYCERFGPALKASAHKHGMECEIVCSGERVENERGKRLANAFRYILLPEVLKEHPSVLMLDLDCIVKRPVEIPDEVNIGFVLRRDTNEDYKKANGGCLYITSQMMDVAIELSEEMRANPVWFYDQVLLWKIYQRLKDEPGTAAFGHKFFSWKFDERAAIWTGKGKIKNQPAWENELRKYEHIRLDWV